MASMRSLWVVLGAVTAAWGQGLVNGGFEEVVDGRAAGWRAYGNYAVTHEVAHSGKQAIAVEVKEYGRGGVMQEIIYEKPDKAPVVFGGWCKSSGASAEYNCIFLDIWYEGGGNAWAQQTHWEQQEHEWEYTAQVFYPEKPIAKIQYFVFLRNGTGRVWFDDLTLERGDPPQGIKSLRYYSDYPYRARGGRAVVELWQKSAWQVALTDGVGTLVREQGGTGTKIELPVEGRVGEVLKIVATAGGKEVTESHLVPPLTPKARSPVKHGGAVWVADSMRRITPLTYPEAAELTNPTIALQVAHNESESVQLQVTTAPDAALEGVRLEFSELRSGAGERLVGTLEWRRVGYVRRAWPYKAHPLGAPPQEQWLPDPLLPAAPFKVRPNTTQGVWLTVHADTAAVAGVYKAEVRVVVGEQVLRRVPIEVEVLGFANPQQFGMRTAFALMDGFTRAQYPENFAEMQRKCQTLMLEYRLNPDDISRTEPPRIEDLLYARERGMNCFNILNLVPQPQRPVKWSCYAPLSVYTPEFYVALKERLTPYVAELRKHGLERYAYVYGFDERLHDYYPAIGELWRNLKRDFPEIPMMTTAMMYRDMRDGKEYPEQNITDWFCPLTSVYDPALSERLRAQGHQVWWYVCCGPTAPHANFASFEYPPVEGRVLGWLGRHYAVDGLLFWHVNLWHDSTPLRGTDTYLPQWSVQNTNQMPGDGQLLYPGVDAPWPSIRLANVRDGVEDYEWLQHYAVKFGEAAAREISGKIVRSMTDFERSPAVIRGVRARLAAGLVGDKKNSNNYY